MISCSPGLGFLAQEVLETAISMLTLSLLPCLLVQSLWSGSPDVCLSSHSPNLLGIGPLGGIRNS